MSPDEITFTFRTMLSPAKARSLWQAAISVRNVDGEVWDIGCNHGGSSAILRMSAPKKPVRMFDSFSGLPASTDLDPKNEPGRFAAQFEEILYMLGPVHAGWVPQIFTGLEDSRISLAHIDLDLYQGTKDALDFVSSRLVTDGIIVVDDYGSDGWSGVTKAVDEFLANQFVSYQEAPEQIILKRR